MNSYAIILVFVLVIFFLVVVLCFFSWNYHCESHKSCNSNEVIILYQPQPDLKTRDERIFYATKIYLNDKEYGNLYGETYSFGTDATRSRKLYFDLPDGLLIVEGLSDSYASNGLLTASTVATIIGGTQKYSNQKGSVLTKKFDDGSYTHTITLNN